MRSEAGKKRCLMNMEAFDHGAVARHIDRICDSDAFGLRPKLCQVLRFLADKTLNDAGGPVNQHVVAEEVLGLGRQASGSSGAAARMQVGRLRKQLDGYYGSVGRNEPMQIEIPKRSYRLRFRAVTGGVVKSRGPRSGRSWRSFTWPTWASGLSWPGCRRR